MVGAVHFTSMTEVLEAALLGLLTRVEKWEPEEVKVFIAQIRADMRKRSIHIMQELYVFASILLRPILISQAMLCMHKNRKGQLLPVAPEPKHWHHRMPETFLDAT